MVWCLELVLRASFEGTAHIDKRVFLTKTQSPWNPVVFSIVMSMFICLRNATKLLQAYTLLKLHRQVHSPMTIVRLSMAP